MLDHIQLVSHDNNILKIASKDIVQSAQHLLPDLRAIKIFLPKQYSQASLHEHITTEASKQGFDAILLPYIGTLKKWVQKKTEYKKPILSQYARELVLVDAIKQQPNLFANANPWSIANELLTLFDEMLLNDVKPNEFDRFYKNDDAELSYALLQESDLIKILWEAWHDQIQDEQYIDPNEAYAQKLLSYEPDPCDNFYCIALGKLTRLEQKFIRKLSNRCKLSFYAYACNRQLSSHSDAWLNKYINSETHIEFIENDHPSPFSQCMNAVFENNTKSIKHRAEDFAKKFTEKALGNKLKIYKSNRFEQHAKAIDIQVRLWINEEINNIGIVTTDRKLVRRLRALLEHANLTVNDPGGWALSTTSAAVIIEWWLQLAEENFPAKQIIALARSTFFPVEDEKLHLQAVNYFEKEVVLRHNLQNGLIHYRKRIEKLQDQNAYKEEGVDNVIFDYLLLLLDNFESSSQIIRKLKNTNSYPLHRFISELINSLKPIGFYTKLKNDAAGTQIIDLLEAQSAQIKLINNDMNWFECRRFMARILDQQNFKPISDLNTNAPRLTFCSLEQSKMQHFDALVIASVDKNSFSGTDHHYIFFNEQVRRECGIPTWRDERDLKLHQFHCLLNAAPKILITLQTEKNGEIIQASPWLEAIETFYQMAYGSDLCDKELEYLVKQSTSTITHKSDIPIPMAIQQPKPILKEELIPTKISISQYQSLVNCPYQYFTLNCLKIASTDELKEELNKADFGSLIHDCIHAFFTHTPGLPESFNKKISKKNRLQAIQKLQIISEKVFNNSNFDNNFNINLWLKRWKQLIPHFIDWEIKQQANSTPAKHEEKISITINQSFAAYGRLDRIDHTADGDEVIDYKTGTAASKKSITEGEQVQLPMYALLNDSISETQTNQVKFVSIGESNTVKSTAKIEQDELAELKNLHLKRLEGFFQNIYENVPFTALGNDDICQRCDAFGICRKPFWSH